MTAGEFRKKIWNFWRKEGRHTLPWRTTTDPYKILVSEVMLQQTQVERVIPYYERFLTRFPDVRALAQAPLAEVLVLWQGLGYNRRARMLHSAAQAVLEKYGGVMPSDSAHLIALPGVGPYTAGAVAAFSGNEDGIFIETNIRTVILHHFFPERDSVSDAEVREVLERVYPKGRAREWYAALMDYGAHLKRSGVKRNSQARGYTKQKAFKGSDREARGALLRALTQGAATKQKLVRVLGEERQSQVEAQLHKLYTEGMVERTGTRYHLPR